MQRQIKFRAWDEQSKVMHYDFQFIQSGELRADWIVFVSDKQPKIKEAIDRPYDVRQFIKMQYTGLKDKNGKKIYERDIVEYFDEIGEVKMLMYEMYHSWIPCYGACSRVLTVNKKGICGEANVIGNIFENKELIQ